MDMTINHIPLYVFQLQLLSIYMLWENQINQN
jgi:hypothetical protein